MKAVVVYESMFGNTHEVAAQIGEGLREAGAEALVVRVGDCTDDLVRSAQLLVVGGPTHIHTMARPRTRTAAVSQATAAHRGAQPGADGIGVREWLDDLGEGHGMLAAAFDTRQNAPKALTGQASRGMHRRLVDQGYECIAPATSFIVDKHPLLLPGEHERALAWGRTLGRAAMTRAPERSHS
jgi:hypothetical protein